MSSDLHDPRALAKRKRREPPCHELVRVLSECDVAGAVADQPGETGTDRRGLHCCSFPFLVNELGRIEPRPLLRFEADIGPRLV